MKIIACARFVFCESCGLHGHILFSDSSKTAELLCLEDASREISRALREKKICDEEADHLRKQLFDSNIPSQDRVSRILGAIDSFFAPDAVEKAASECPGTRTLH